MTAIEIARQFAALGQIEGAIKAYGVALHAEGMDDPAVKMEAAVYVLQNGGDYKVSYSTLVELYQQGQFQEDCLSILTQAFYEPNVKLLKNRYQNNCKLLRKYPYLFRKDFPEFELLPLRFYPFDDNCFVPYRVQEERFGEYIDFKKAVVSRNFFHNLDNPILAKDVYSQYELEYLRDNVRRSEDVGRENHVYLHYSDWEIFCAHLQCLNIKPLLEEKKIVFLIGDEVEQYPIDFKDRFHIDYSTFAPKSIGVRDVHRLIWHTQLSSHNGGDFFNEIFDNHPNLLVYTSVMFGSLVDAIKEIMDALTHIQGVEEAVQKLRMLEPQFARELYLKRDRTEKDVLVAFFLTQNLQHNMPSTDPTARIAPALFFQPHFYNMLYTLTVNKDQSVALFSEQYEEVRISPLIQDFKYIKTFTPLRRFTTSHGATVKFMLHNTTDEENTSPVVLMSDAICQRLLNRSFMVDWQDRLYVDSVLVRFEDGKLNPKATFTALAAFLDLPYTESLLYCSLFGERDPESLKGNDLGFSLAAIYRTYDEYANDAERYFLEYYLRDAYVYYGYDFKYYDGAEVNEAKVYELIDGFTTINHHMEETLRVGLYEKVDMTVNGKSVDNLMKQDAVEKIKEQYMKSVQENRRKNATTLLRSLRFVNKNGQPLHMMPKLELDPALLEQPLYH